MGTPVKERMRQWRKRHPNLEHKRNCELKKMVLSHYGNNKDSCVICGENRLDCLSIDHINDDGAKHKREIGYASGSNLYRWLQNNKYPEGFQVLCMNCQFIKRVENNEMGY